MATSSYDNEDGRNKLKKAELTSDVQTDEELGKGVQRKKTGVLPSESESEDEAISKKTRFHVAAAPSYTADQSPSAASTFPTMQVLPDVPVLPSIDYDLTPLPRDLDLKQQAMSIRANLTANQGKVPKIAPFSESVLTGKSTFSSWRRKCQRWSQKTDVGCHCPHCCPPLQQDWTCWMEGLHGSRARKKGLFQVETVCSHKNGSPEVLCRCHCHGY